MWSGTRLKDAKRGDVDMKLVDKYCARLEESLANMHEQVRDVETARRRTKALRESKASPMRFNVGDLVMIPSEDNMANPLRHSKPMCR